MDYTIFMDYLSKALMAVAILVAVTNIIVEVLKAVMPRVNANYFAIGTALVLSFAAFFAWMGFAGIAFEWYYLAPALVLGIMVAYAAMFGFDKLKEMLEGIKK